METQRRNDILLFRIGIMLLLSLLQMLTTQIHAYVSGMQQDRVLHFVSHRPANVDLADEIIGLQKGRMCCKGTHEELLERCEPYRRLYHYQADKYAKER